jgi:hypothetical protein
MDTAGTGDPLESARENAMDRIRGLREREPAAGAGAMPDLRTILNRAEQNVGAMHDVARDLAALLPTRVEAAVARALGEDEGGLGRRLDEVRAEVLQTGAAVERIERDLVAERLGRVEDLEVLVDLLSAGLAAMRAQLNGLTARVDSLGSQFDKPIQLTVSRMQATPPRTEPAGD